MVVVWLMEIVVASKLKEGRREARTWQADFEARGLQRTCTCYVVSCRYPDPVKVL